MENKHIAVVGKVVNGVVTVFAAVEGRVVGYRKPLFSTPTETFETRMVEAHEVPRDIRKAAMQGKQDRLTTLLEQHKGEEDMRIDRTTGQTYMGIQKKQPAIKPVEAIDIPQFMKDRTKKMQEAKVQKKRKGSIFDLRV